MSINKPPLVERKRMRMINHDYSQPSAYFITICAAEKKQIFCEIVQGNAVFELPKIKLSDIGSVVNETIISLNEKYDNIIVEKYVIMPNHIHMIVTILASDDMFLDGMSGTPSHNLNGMSGTPSHNLNGMSGTPSHNLNGMSGTPSPTNAAANAVIPSFVGTLKRFANKRCGFSMFQRSYYDHIIRNQRDYDEIWDYIDSNPVKWKQDCYYF